MKKFFIVLIVVLFSMQSVKAEEPETIRVYAELVGNATNMLGLNKNVKVTIDLGQYQSGWKSYKLQDENNNDIKFNSMVAAMNYMGQRGWKFVQTYVISSAKQQVYHWLMYKDVSNDNEILEGLNIKNME